jgi:proline iminopeptidase
LTVCFLQSIAFSQVDLYHQTFGDSSHPALIYLHGGPGYNCSTFEASTAQSLADLGFFVIVYDRRGEGRSSALTAKYSFEESLADINVLMKQFKISKVSLLGHSFGGMLAIKYAEEFPQNVEELFLIGAPISLQKTFKNIISRSKEIYTSKGDSTNLTYINLLEKMDTTALMYGSYSFMHAMQNGFYSPKKPTNEAIQIMQKMSTHPAAQYFSKMTTEGPTGFYQTEKYTMLDLMPEVQKLVKNRVKITGIYGEEDGLYSVDQVFELQDVIGKDNIFYFSRCSHSVFIDQQSSFLEVITTNLNHLKK